MCKAFARANRGTALNAGLAKVTFLVDDGKITEIANSLLRGAKGGATFLLECNAESDRRARGPRDDCVVSVAVSVVAVFVIAVAENLIFYQDS